MNKLYYILGLLVVTATNVDASIFAKKKSGRTCIVCKQQMAWSDGHLLTFQNYLDDNGKHKVVIVKTDKCVEEVYANKDFYLKKKPSIWSMKHNKHGVSVKELFKN
jgi:hypothetical protein